MAEATQRNHSVAVAQFAVTGQAGDVEPTLAAIENLHDLFLAGPGVGAQLKRESVFADRADLPRHSRLRRGDGQRERTARDRAFWRLPVRALLVGLEPGVVVHVLPAGRTREDRRQTDEQTGYFQTIFRHCSPLSLPGPRGRRESSPRCTSGRPI